MKTIRSAWLLGCGIVLLSSAFLYDVYFAGLPYQDPTAGMQQTWNFHKFVADSLLVLGAVLMTLAVLSFIVRMIRRKK